MNSQDSLEARSRHENSDETECPTKARKDIMNSLQSSGHSRCAPQSEQPKNLRAHHNTGLRSRVGSVANPVVVAALLAASGIAILSAISALFAKAEQKENNS